jgi:CheY-like chemotaxis protein
MDDLDDSVAVRQGQPVDAPTALIIDDEAMIRQLIHRVLEPEICRVTEAPTAEEGLRIIERGIPPIDLVLTDLKMPGLDGWDVVEVLAKHRPDLPVAVISGYGGGGARARSLGVRLLPKPFTAAAVHEVVSALIADARAARARAQGHRAHAAQARQGNALIRRQHAEMCVRLDLVAAAWDLRRHRPGPE